MHATPAFQMTVRHFGVWQLACSVLVVLAAIAWGAWAWSAMAAFWDVSLGWVVGALLVLLVASSALLVQAFGLKPVSLRWDTQRWHLGPAASAGHEPWSGQLDVCMDLGSWMLLCFAPENAPVLRPRMWLPVQRRAHRASWHALRCTVYCARPVALPTAAPF